MDLPLRSIDVVRYILVCSRTLLDWTPEKIIHQALLDLKEYYPRTSQQAGWLDPFISSTQAVLHSDNVQLSNILADKCFISSCGGRCLNLEPAQELKAWIESDMRRNEQLMVTRMAEKFEEIISRLVAQESSPS